MSAEIDYGDVSQVARATDKLRAYGNGSLSAGIVKAATKLRKPSD